MRVLLLILAALGFSLLVSWASAQEPTKALTHPQASVSTYSKGIDSPQGETKP